MPGWEEFSRIKKCFIVDIDWCGEERERGEGVSDSQYYNIRTGWWSGWSDLNITITSHRIYLQIKLNTQRAKIRQK